jgi:adenylate cyclase
MEATFCFVDLAGFSALTEAHGDAAAADLVLRFTSLVTTTMGVTARLVKTIGDAAFVALPAPAQAVGFIGRLVARIAQESDFPVLRAGMHHGDAVERNGDVFGAAVNLAARVAAYARGGQVLGTAPIADAARQAGRSVTSLGSVRLRNLREPVELFDLGVDVCDDEVIDPVCRMRVAPGRAVGRLTLSGSSYWFCSLRCAGLFARDPGAYAP